MLWRVPADVSVLMPYRDAAATVAEALESVLTEGVVAEVVAVDDGSKDEGPEIVASIARRDRRVRCLRTEGLGVAGALAFGWRELGSELVARMDADDVSLPGRIERTRAHLLDDPRLAAVGTRVEAFPEPGAGLVRYVDWLNELSTPEEHARDVFVEAPLCHPSVILRRSAVEAVGGYVDRPWPQDYDLWLRLVAAGWGLAKLPETLLRWRHLPTRVSFNNPRNAPARLVLARARYLAPVARRARSVPDLGCGRHGQGSRSRARVRGRMGPGLRRHRSEEARPSRARQADRGGRASPRRDRSSSSSPSARRVRARIVRGRLLGAGKTEGVDFVCAA
jgi:hypothetical protein